MLAQKKNVAITTKNITKTYMSGTETFTAVKNVTLDIYDGDFTVIMGASGSGKSTLLHCLSGLDDLSSGNVCIRGQQIDKLSETKSAGLRAKKIGFVYQNINLVPDMTIFENIAFPGYISGDKKSAVRERVSTLMSQMGIADLKNRFPAQVSGGQQQRAAIARAIVNAPEIVFADEPTGSLNREYGTAILDILTRMNKAGQTVIMVTHDIRAAARADRMIYIKDGTIAGTLELGKYRESDTLSREKSIFTFISGREQ